MKKIIRISITFIVAIFFFSSCASIVSRSSYPITINSSPSNAQVSITDKKGNEIFAGNTPAIVRLSAGYGFFSRAEYQVKFSNPGYNDRVIPIKSKLDNWYFGNILFGGLIGMLIVDPASGAMWRIDIDSLNENLNVGNNSETPEIEIIKIEETPKQKKDWDIY